MNFTPLNRGRKQNKDTKAKNNKSDCLSTAHLGSHQSTLNTIREEKMQLKAKKKAKKGCQKYITKSPHCSPGFTPLNTITEKAKIQTKSGEIFLFIWRLYFCHHSCHHHSHHHYDHIVSIIVSIIMIILSSPLSSSL